MILKAYSVRDTKAEYFNTPFFNKTHGEAERNFTDLVNDKNTSVGQHPTDFDLYYLGEFDTQSGKITGLTAPEHQLHGANLVRKMPENQAQH